MVGRGLRLAPGKKDCLVLDFTDNCRRHKLMAAADLLGRPKLEKEEADQDEEAAPRGRREKREVKILEWRMAYVCPWPEMPSLEGYAPDAELPWQAGPATEKQLAYLKRLGVAVGADLTAGEVSYLIDRAKEMEAAFPAPATPQQKFCLRKAGLWKEGTSRKEASRLIAQVKRNERRKPS
jgi:hypothetical protein